jgi:hypothetical protein
VIPNIKLTPEMIGESSFLGIPVQLSELTEPGKIITVPHTHPVTGDVIEGSVACIVMHPLDWNRVTHDGDPHGALDGALEYFLKKIDQQADAAVKRIDAMFRPQPIGIIADGPMTGLLAYYGYGGKVHTRGHYVLAHG